MHRFFVNPSQIDGSCILIKGNDVKHIGAVLRMKKNENLIVCDGQNTDYNCIIKDISKEEIELEIMEKKRNTVESQIKVKLYQSLPKLDKMDLIVQKCVELGIDEIVPIITERTISKTEDIKRIQKKVERWNKISESAAKQCMRGKIPIVANPIDYIIALEQAKDLDKSIIPYEKEYKISLRSCIKDFVGTTIGVFIGPEGGFSEREIETAVKYNLQPVTLGNRILRTETAGFVVLANIMYELGDE